MLENFRKSIALVMLSLMAGVTLMDAQIAVGRNQNGTLEVDRFYTDTLISRSQIVPNGRWDSENSLQNVFSNYFLQVAAGQDNFGVRSVFAVDSLGNVLQRVSQSSGFGFRWDLLGPYHQISGIVVGQNVDGRLELFAVDFYGTLLHKWQNNPWGGWSSDWVTLGSGHRMVKMAVGRNQDGRLEIFGADNNGIPVHLWQTTPGGGWTDWATLGSGHYYMRAITVGQNQDGRLEAFSIDSSGTLLHLAQITPGGGWTDWATLGSGHHMSTIAVDQNQDGRLEVFGVDTYGNFLRILQTAPNGGWTNWANPGGGSISAAIAVAHTIDGRLEVFGFASNPTPIHIWQTAPNSDSWSMWQPLDGSVPSGGYAYCSGEDGSCNFTGTARVGYGANGNFVFQVLTNGTACNNGVFGDPAPGLVKACFIPAGTLGFRFCSMEGGVCSFTGTASVEYGADGIYLNRRFTNGTACNNGAMADPNDTPSGDPTPGVPKACFVSQGAIGPSPTPTPTPQPTPLPTPAPKTCQGTQKCCETDAQGNCTLCVAQKNSCP